MSLNQWMAVAVAEKVGVAETAAEFFQRRAGGTTGVGMMKFYGKLPMFDLNQRTQSARVDEGRETAAHRSQRRINNLRTLHAAVGSILERLTKFYRKIL